MKSNFLHTNKTLINIKSLLDPLTRLKVVYLNL